MSIFWKTEDIKLAQSILRKHGIWEYQKALDTLSKSLGREVTAGALRGAFLRNECGPPTSFCLAESSDEEILEESEEDSEHVEQLVKLVKRGPVSFVDICDKLDLSPSKTREVIEEAKGKGIKVKIEHNQVGIPSSEPLNFVQETKIAPVVGKRQKVAVISDTHLGSKYCLRAQLKEFIHYAYDQGVREVLHPGDVLDGMYRHGVYEVSHVGVDDQAQDLYETLPQLPGLTYHGITGNHDETFTNANGVDVGHFITNYFAARGRHDFKFYGNRGAFLRVRGATIHLWHPRSGGSYAKSYGIQKQVEKYTVVKPNILLTGHWHTYCHIYDRGVHAFACPTFQGGGSSFGKSLGGAPSIGGMLLSWELTEHGTLRSLSHEYRAYFEVEKPLEINHLDGTMIIQ